ncbi:hypothetical protein HO173_010139 [Letharia columbiana]|uniref:Uncharacterized protein n=1 Tax=Letharia columbiana TaxID=112416 RepID=A0A8H6FN66_9LECA|nr:uncharacterized protein HO173_010139 [Letharia columbiana]KAF6231607.1 hypothetical protein HO173_010139 [Letharia columbiana]
MDRIPLEVYRLIVSMIDDEEEDSLCAPDRDCSPSTTADVGTLQSVSNSQVQSHTTSSRRHSSSIVESTKNMQRRLQNRLAAFRKFQLLTLVRKLCANMPTKGKREDLDTEPGMTINRLATLKSLRLCNKKLALMTAEFVFEEVLLHFTEESHAKLEDISQHTYRKHVRVLHIVPKAISGPLLQKKEFGQWLRGERTLIDNPLVLYVGQDYAGPLVMPDCAKISRKAIKFHYKEYSSLHAEQQKLFSTAEGILQAAVGRLPQLKRVESGLSWDWTRRRQDIPPNDFEPKPGWNWHFKRLDISPRDDIIDRVWKTGSCQTNFDMDQGTMILRAIAYGRASSGAHIDAGPLFRDLSKIVMEIKDPKEKAVVETLMTGTKHFNFYLKLADLDEVQDLMSSGTIISFLQTMPKLESLRFRSTYLGTEDRLENAFGNSITWPHLTYFSIKSVDNFDFGGLAALIQRHKASLRQLALYDVYYDYENRSDLWADLRAGALDKIRIWSMGRRAAEQGPSDLDWEREAHGWANPGSPYVFSGGAWSPKLGSDLREELVAKLFPSFAHTQGGLLAEDEDWTKEAGSEI